MIIPMNGCPFKPDNKTIILNDKDVVQTSDAAAGNLVSAATLYSFAFVNTPDANTVNYILEQLLNSAIEAIATLNGTSYRTVLEQIRVGNGALSKHSENDIKTETVSLIREKRDND